jgi:DNA-directed RNA polymerase subunit omega
MLPSPDILNEFQYGKYVLSNLAAKRAKQLREGAPPLVAIESNHPLTIALAEIAAGKIKPVLPSGVEGADGADSGLGAFISEEPLPAELGMLLPALDEAEVVLVAAPVVGDEDHVDEAEHESDVEADPAVSLADLVGDDDEEEEEPAPDASEDDTLSLSDIAEQETEEEEETEE